MNLEENVQKYIKIEDEIKKRLIELNKLREYKTSITSLIIADLEKEKENKAKRHQKRLDFAQGLKEAVDRKGDKSLDANVIFVNSYAFGMLITVSLFHVSQLKINQQYRGFYTLIFTVSLLNLKAVATMSCSATASTKTK